MKRDKELMRLILARIEALPIKPGEVWHITPEENDAVFVIEGYSLDEINYNLSLLIEGGYLASDYSQPMVGAILSGLSNRGHDFLDQNPAASAPIQINSSISDLRDAFARYDEATTDVMNSSHEFFETNLKRWLEMLDSTPSFARPILQRLESAANFDGWFAPYRQGMNGAGVAQIEWPVERERRLGTQLLLLRQFANGGVDARLFAFLVLHTGKHMPDGIRHIITQIFAPTSRELKRYLSELQPDASLVPDRLAPAADRAVRLDHNSAPYKEVMEQLEKLTDALEHSNSYPDDENKEQHVAELSAGTRLLRSVRVRVLAVSALLGAPLMFLSKTFASDMIGHLATALWQGIKLLFGL